LHIGSCRKSFRLIGRIAYAMALIILLLRVVNHTEKVQARELSTAHRKPALVENTNSSPAPKNIAVAPEPSAFTIVSIFACGMMLHRKRTQDAAAA
jgi:hypothetical protein